MKNFKIFLFSYFLFVCFLISPIDTHAKTILSCEYNHKDSLVGDSKVTVRFEDGFFSNSIKVDVNQWLGKNKTLTEKLKNASDFMYIFEEASPVCPPAIYVYHQVYTSGMYDFEATLGHSATDFDNRAKSDYSFVLYSNNYIPTVDDQEKYYESLEAYKAEIIKRYEEYSAEDCKNETNPNPLYCKNRYESNMNYLIGIESQLTYWIEEGYISADDPRTISFYEAVDQAHESWSEVQEEIRRQEEGGNTSDPTTAPPLEYGDLDIAKYCTNVNVAKTLRFVGYLLFLVKIFVPALIIILGSIDFGQAVLASKEDEIKKRIPIFIKRIAAGIIIFFIPTILDFLFSRLDGYSESISRYSNCRTCILNPNSCNVSG